MSFADRFRRQASNLRDAFRAADLRDAAGFRRRAIPRTRAERAADNAVATAEMLWGADWRETLAAAFAPAPSLRIPRYVTAAGY